ncbi:MAG: hypothetical protein V4649_05305 [Bacteroidota bacterium]
MLYKTLLSLCFFQLFFSEALIAQKELSAAEAQDFYKLIKQTAEYKILKAEVDSINKIEDQIPQELKIEIVSKDQSAPEDDYIFQCTVTRRLSIGLRLQQYVYQYDKRKKKIISIKH